MTAIRTWFRKFTGRRSTTIRKPQRTAPSLGLEQLDARVLLSATAAWNSATGNLRIDSDGASDQIRVLEVGPLNMTQLALIGVSSLSVNGQAPVAAVNPTLPTWGVRSLDVRLNGGDDTLTVTLSRWAINVMPGLTMGGSYWNSAADTLRTISVDGGAGKDTIDVSGTFSATATLIGGTEDDTITGTQLADTIRGGGGADTIRGGAGNDVIYGDAGDDTLWGEGGNDNLYGGDGADILYGGSGNDGLYGGMGKDYLWGGDPVLGSDFGGKNRFLILADEPNPGGPAITDTIMYFNVWSDARIKFTNGPQMTTSFAGQLGSYTYSAGAFTAAEIEQTDGAFSALVNRTQNTRLLKKSDGTELLFEKQGMVTNATGNFSAGAWNDGAKMHLLNLSFDAANPTVVQGYLIHEIGHNWDSVAENASFGEFQALSGWTTSAPAATSISYWKASDTGTNWWYLRSAGMVSTYAQTNPQEDFAESFRSYFGFGNAAAAPLKMAYLDGFFNGKSG